MSKRISIYFIMALLLAAGGGLGGCVEKTEIVPNEQGQGGEDGGDNSGNGGDDRGDHGSYQSEKVSIAYLKTMYNGRATKILRDIAVQGVITANDSDRNPENTLIIEDETGGIEIKLSGRQLYVDFPIGATLRVSCQGLTMGSYGGVVSLGMESADLAYENGFIADSQKELYMQRTSDPVVIPEPKEVEIHAITDADVGRLICIEGVQFVNEEMSLRWCETEQNTDRHLVDRNGSVLTVGTNHTADFSDELLPSGSGYIEGVLSYFAGNYQLRVVRKMSVIFDETRF